MTQSYSHSKRKHQMRFYLYNILFILCAQCAAEDNDFVRGQLLDENGMAPLANQEVFSDSVGTKVAVTDSMGYFNYPIKNNEQVIHVLPWSKEIVGRSVFINVSDFKGSVFKIVVERGVTLLVKVVASDNSPILGASVSWVGSGGAGGESDENGIARVGRISRYKNGGLLVRVTGCKEVSKNDLCAASYVDREISITIPDYVVVKSDKSKGNF